MPFNAHYCTSRKCLNKCSSHSRMKRDKNTTKRFRNSLQRKCLVPNVVQLYLPLVRMPCYSLTRESNNLLYSTRVTFKEGCHQRYYIHLNFALLGRLPPGGLLLGGRAFPKAFIFLLVLSTSLSESSPFSLSA